MAILIVLACGASSLSIADEPATTPLAASYGGAFPPWDTFTLRVNGQPLQARPIWIRLAGQATVLAYSLSAFRPVKPSSRWSIADAHDTALSQVAIAQWLARTAPARETLVEYFSRQISIWHFTDGIQIDASSVPNAKIRRGAQSLVGDVLKIRRRLRVDDQPTNLLFPTYIASADVDTVTLAIPLLESVEQSLDFPTCIDVQISGKDTTIVTGETSYIHQSSSRRVPPRFYTAKDHPRCLDTARKKNIDVYPYKVSALVKRRTLSANPQKPRRNHKSALTTVRDFNVARINITRGDDPITVYAHVQNSYTAGTPLVGIGGAANVITAGKTDVEFATTFVVDPRQLPSPQAYVTRVRFDKWRWFPSLWLRVIILIAALYAVARYAILIDAAVKRVWARFRHRKSVQATAQSTSTLSPDDNP